MSNPNHKQEIQKNDVVKNNTNNEQAINQSVSNKLKKFDEIQGHYHNYAKYIVSQQIAEHIETAMKNYKSQITISIHKKLMTAATEVLKEYGYPFVVRRSSITVTLYKG